MDKDGSDGIAGRRVEGVFEKAGVGEGIEEGGKLADLEVGEWESMLEKGIGDRGDDHIFSIVFEDAQQGEKAAVVSIGMGDGDISQGRDFEFQGVFVVAGDPHSAKVVEGAVQGQTGIAVGKIGEQRFAVTAAAFLFEDRVAETFGQRERVLPPHDPVVLAVRADEHDEELAQDPGHALGVDDGIAEGFPEKARIGGITLQLVEGARDGLPHFSRGGKRGEWLKVEMSDAAIPHVFFLPRQVLQGRGVSGSQGIVDAVAQRMFVSGEGAELLVATGAGDGGVAAETFVIKQFSAEQEAFPRKRVLFKIVLRCGPAGGNGQR